MSITYELTVANGSGRDQNYVFFFAPERIDGPSLEIFSTVWAISFIPNGANQMFYLTNEFAGFTGTVPGGLSPGKSVDASDFLGVELGSDGTPGTQLEMTAMGGTPVIQLASNPTTQSTPGAFSITTSTDFTPENGFQIGCAIPTINGGPMTPIFTIAALPGTTTQIAPKMKIYVAAADYQVGQIFQFGELQYQAGMVDYAELGVVNASITQNVDGTWTSGANMF